MGGGSYSGKTVTTTVANEGGVKAAGATLTFDAIGEPGMPVGSVEAMDGGSLISLGDINTELVNLQNGELHSEQAINAQRLDMVNGAMISTDTVTVKGDGTGIGNMKDSSIISLEGDVVLEDDFRGNGLIQAGGDIIGKTIGPEPGPSYGHTLSLTATGSVKVESLEANSLFAAGVKSDNDVRLAGGQMRITGENGTNSEIGGDLVLTAVNAVAAGNMTVNGGVKLNSHTNAVFENLTVESGNLQVGNGTDNAGSRLTVTGTLDLNGQVLVVDPAWGSTPSNVAVNSINDNPTAQDILINGGVAVGQNSYAAIGTDNAGWLPSQVPGGLSPTGTTAALGIFKPVTVAAGQKIYLITYNFQRFSAAYTALAES